MTEKLHKKPLIEYEIQTTHELEEIVYRAIKMRTTGHFVKFEPYESKKEGFEPSLNERGTVVILPERVIKSIFEHKITAEEIKKQLKQK
jgi:hypothetical protein